MKDNHERTSIYYPPGGILIWIIIFLELITFGMAVIAFTLSFRNEPDVFKQSSEQLHIGIGSINTIVLLVSGYFMATAVHYAKQQMLQKLKLFIKLSVFGGIIFILLKGIEYYMKLQNGISIDTNTFYTYYWLLTLFHLVHVLVGLVIILVVYLQVNKSSSIGYENIEATGAFWHMCDLIWLIIFPILYLIY